jgi:ribosomal protein S11
VYIADYQNNRIRKVTISTGIITSIAGTGTASYSGDNDQATSAGLNYPYGVALDSTGTFSFLHFLFNFLTSSFYLGNVYIADYFNYRIRKVTISTGIITTIAGTGTDGYSGDNDQATSAQLNWPSGVALDVSGNCSRQHFVLCY